MALPGLGIETIKAKVDSGARTSSLHAVDLESFRSGDEEFVRFVVHPEQRTADRGVECQAKVLEYRPVKSSNGQTETRPVIVTEVRLLGELWAVELTLSNRDEMGFRMLLGREAIRKRFLIDAGRSYCGGNASSPPTTDNDANTEE